MKKIKVIDNLLPEIYFNKLKNILDNNQFNWFWNNKTVSIKNSELDNHFMFTHMLWDEDKGSASSYFETFEPILYFLDNHSPVKGLLRMKLNLYTNQNKKIHHAKHVDFANQDTGKPLENTTNTVLNFTDCNGGTIIDNKEYPSKANQALIFSNDLIHQGIVQTDTPRRIVLNIATNKKHEL